MILVVIFVRPFSLDGTDSLEKALSFSCLDIVWLPGCLQGSKLEEGVRQGKVSHTYCADLSVQFQSVVLVSSRSENLGFFLSGGMNLFCSTRGLRSSDLILKYKERDTAA